MGDNDWKIEIFKAFSLVGQLGFIVIFSILIPLFFGYLLDNYLNTGYIFKIIFLIFGVIAGYWNGAKLLRKFIDRL